MKYIQLSQSRFIAGMVLVVVAALMFVFAGADYTAGAVAIAVLGLVSIAISRRK